MLYYLLRLSLVLSISFWPFHNGKQGAPPIKKSSYDLPAQPLQHAFIKILILPGADEISVSTDGAYSILDAQRRVVFQGPKLPVSKIKARGESIQIGVQSIQTNPIMIESPGYGVRIKGAHYRQAVEVWRETNGKITVINDITVEDYLKGVLPSEVNPRWPMESLKAQAIASRTYALFKMIENGGQRYHLSKDVLSQVYGGKNLEHSVTTRAVEETQGQILVYKNKVFPAYFHSTCGGLTTRAENIWSIEPHPSLEGVECNFCWKSRHYRWQADFTKAEIEKKLSERGVKMAGFRDLKVGEKDRTGRANYFLITTAAEGIPIQSNDFRLWVSPQKLKSTWIQSITKTKTGYSMKGRGWGHGVGLCQYGTKQLGEMGYSHERILNYYYPESQIVQYWSEMPKSLRSSLKGLVTQVKQKLDLE